MSPIIRQMHHHPVAFCIAIIVVYASFVWAMTGVRGVLS